MFCVATQVERVNTMTPARKMPEMDSYSGRLGYRLRKLRNNAKLSIDEVAERMEKFGYTIKPNTFRHWEIARTSPPWDAVPAIAKALKVKPRELVPVK